MVSQLFLFLTDNNVPQETWVANVAWQVEVLAAEGLDSTTYCLSIYSTVAGI